MSDHAAYIYKELYLYIGNIEAQIMDANSMDVDIVHFPQYFMEQHTPYTWEAIARYKELCRHPYVVVEYDEMNTVINFTTYKKCPVHSLMLIDVTLDGKVKTYYNQTYIEITQRDIELPDISALDIYGEN